MYINIAEIKNFIFLHKILICGKFHKHAEFQPDLAHPTKRTPNQGTLSNCRCKTSKLTQLLAFENVKCR